MKLSAAAIEEIRDRVGLEPVPTGHPIQEKLIDAFGEHTFYIDGSGLYVWEPVTQEERLAGPMYGHGGETAIAYKLAAWTSEDMNVLAVHEPQRTTQAIVIPVLM